MARRFRGESVHKVDAKGRVSIPASFRRVLEEGDPDWRTGTQPQVVLIYGRKRGKCIEGFSINGADELDNEIRREARFSKKRQAMARLINTKSDYAQVDPNGRIVLSQKLREEIGLTNEAMFAGMGDMFQIWEPGKYEADVAAMDNWLANQDDDDTLAALDDDWDD